MSQVTMRPVDRFRIFLLISIVTGLALGSFWVLEVMRREAITSPPSRTNSTYDYYIEHFDVVKFSKVNRARYKISGEKLTHHPNSGSYQIVGPTLQSLDKDQPPMTIKADQAVATQDGSKVEMLNHVQVLRPQFKNNELFLMRTEYLLALPDDEIIQTEKPVEIQLGSAILNGIGMRANNGARDFKILHQARATYPAKIAK